MSTTYGNGHIDFDNLTQDQTDVIKDAVKIISAYMEDIKGTNESIKDTLSDLVVKMDADKDSTKKLKKFVKTAAKVSLAKNAEQIREDNTSIERILEKIGELVA